MTVAIPNPLQAVLSQVAIVMSIRGQAAAQAPAANDDNLYAQCRLHVDKLIPFLDETVNKADGTLSVRSVAKGLYAEPPKGAFTLDMAVCPKSFASMVITGPGNGIMLYRLITFSGLKQPIHLQIMR